ncbi:MAG TPA: hypothetical protein VFQ60_04715 [Patescibacteria group bacterium]|nr:hypothetical protein [Patescibacteria group bacterium]
MPITPTSTAPGSASSTAWGTVACTSDTVTYLTQAVQPTLNGSFQGKSIASIASTYLANSGAKAIAFTSASSTDGKRLVIGYLSCEGVICRL